MHSAWSSSVRRSTGSPPFRLPPGSAGPDRRPVRHRRWSKLAVVGTPTVAMLLLGTVLTPSASAAQTVQLGTATPFAVLAGSAVTDVPTSSITGNVGLSPAVGSSYTGLTQGQVTGTIYAVDGTGPGGAVNNPALLTTAKNDLTTAYGAAAGQTPITTFSSGDNQLGGQTLTAGVYAYVAASTANITAASPLTLNGQGDPNAVFVFQTASTLITASSSVVQLENGAQACNVFWQVGSSATLGSSSTFVGTIMALQSATLANGATVQGRVLAQNGAVTLDHNTITAPSTCTVAAPATTTTTTTTAAGTGGTGTTGKGTTGTGGSGAGGNGGSIVTTGSTTSGEAATGTGSAAGAGSGPAVVPSGFPHTGFGGAAHSRDDGLIILGALALAGSMAAFTTAVRRRRPRPGGSAPGAV